MESVEDAADRQQCLKLAEDNGLPLRETRVTAVQNILWREVEGDEQADEKKVRSKITSPAIFENAITVLIHVVGSRTDFYIACKQFPLRFSPFSGCC
jgi:hypothetical protein